MFYLKHLMCQEDKKPFYLISGVNI